MAKAARSPGGSLSRMSVQELHREISRRQRRVAAMMRRRESLAARLNRLDEDIRLLGGSIRGRVAAGAAVRRRPKNKTNLVGALAELLKGKTMGVTEAAQAVQEAGYRTNSDNFRTIVNQALISSGQFKRVGRGKYTAKA